MKPEYDEHREERITMRAVVDAYGPEEQAMGWYDYLENELTFPFRAKCVRKRAKSALKQSECYLIIRMADEDECDDDMYVMAQFDDDELAVPLSQLELDGDIDEDTKEALLDWKYWCDQGYRFS